MTFGWFSAEAAFLHESALTLRVGNLLRRENLDGFRAVQVQVLRLVHDPHAAFAEFLCYPVVPERLPIMRNPSSDRTA